MNLLEAYGMNERFINEATLYPQCEIARVVAQYRGLYKIATQKGECYAEISGKLNYNTTQLASYPAVGDFVMVSLDENGAKGIIHHVLTRKSTFARTAVGMSGQTQIVATNVDIVFLCMSLNQNYNLSRMERYLSIAWDSGATPVILLTKSDLCHDLAGTIAEVERISSFSDVIATSVFSEETVKQILRYMKPNITAAFIGSSGVGKSTLINQLLGGEKLTTQTIGWEDKGRHTTTGREMYILPQGGVVIDTPGMREIGVEHGDLTKSFQDIEALAERCKFHDCTHTSEPGCAIQEALTTGALEPRRFENYNKIKIESGYQGLNSKEIETKKLERMFKEVGGMKNARKHLKDKKRNQY